MPVNEVMTFDCQDALAAIAKALAPVPPSQRGRKSGSRKVGPGVAAHLSRFTVLIPDSDLPPISLLADALDDVLNQVPDAKDEIWPPFAVARVPADHPMMKKAREEGVTHEGNGWVLLSVDNALDRYFGKDNTDDDRRIGPYDVLLGLNVVHAEALLEVTESYFGAPEVREDGRSLADTPDAVEGRVYLLHTVGNTKPDMHVTVHDGVNVDGALTTSPVDTTQLADEMKEAQAADSLLGRLSRRALGEDLPVVIAPRTLLNYYARYAFGNRLDPVQAAAMATVFGTPVNDLLTAADHPVWTELAAVLMETSSPEIQFFSHAAQDREATPSLLIWAGAQLAVELTRPSYLTADLSAADDSECVDLEKARHGLWRLTALHEALESDADLVNHLRDSFNDALNKLNFFSVEEMGDIASVIPGGHDLPTTLMYYTMANMLACMEAPEHIPTIWWDSDFPLLNNDSSPELQSHLARINADIAADRNCPQLVNDMMTLLTVATDRYRKHNSHAHR